MTKVEAIKKVLEELGGVATWEQIYNNIEKYYPAAKKSKAWKEGIRGVLYREIRKNRNFKRLGLGIYSLKEYQEEEKPTIEEKERMHTYIQGICLEIGKFKGFDVYTPDKNVLFRDNIYLKDLITLDEVPPFTYSEIIKIIKKIDVIWFNKKGFKFPQYAFEIIHTLGTLSEALNRCLQLSYFNTKFIIIGPSDNKYQNTFLDKLNRNPYLEFKERFDYKNYDIVIELYESSVKHNKIEEEFFKASIWKGL